MHGIINASVEELKDDVKVNHREILKLVQSMDARLIEMENQINIATNNSKETTYIGRKSFNINIRPPSRMGNDDDKLDDPLDVKETSMYNMDDDSKSNVFEEIKEE